MIEFFSQYRGAIQTLIVLAYACFIAMTVVRGWRLRARAAPSRSAGRAIPHDQPLVWINEAGAVALGVIWTVLCFKGPSLPQLWQGARGFSAWAGVLLYTMIWLSASQRANPETSAEVRAVVPVRVLMYGLMLVIAVVALNDW